MNRKKAVSVNQKTKSLNEKLEKSLVPQSDINVSNVLENFYNCNDLYEHQDITAIAESLLKKYYHDVEKQFEAIASMQQLTVFLDRLTSNDFEKYPIFIIFNKDRIHWTTFCLTSYENNLVILYKDSYGNSIPEDVKNAILQILPQIHSENFKFHSSQEQEDGSSCGPMSLKNMEIMMQNLNNKERRKYFIINFSNTQCIQFCEQNDVQSVRDEFKEQLHVNLNSYLNNDLADLSKDQKFKQKLKSFIDETYSVYIGLINDDSLQEYLNTINSEVEKHEKNPNYEINKNLIEEKRNTFHNNPEIHKKITEIKGTESNIDVSKTDIDKQYPREMQKFTRIFEVLCKTKIDGEHENILKKVSEIFELDYNIVCKFYEFSKEKGKLNNKVKDDNIKIKAENKIVNNKTLFENLPSKKQKNNSQDLDDKSFDQLLYELVLRHNQETNLQDTKIQDPNIKLSGEALKQYYKNSYQNDKAKITLKKQYKGVKEFYKSWEMKSAEEINKWAISNKGYFQQSDLCELIAVMDRTNELATGSHRLRRTQILSLLIFMQSNSKHGHLCEIHTGEGKTTIVSALAAIKILQGVNTLDVITSNSVLAREAAEDRATFYGLLGITVSYNNTGDDYVQGARGCYEADVVYGSIGSFQFDFLRHSFEGLETRGSRQFDFVILDEVDSMLVDNGRHIAKLSTPFPGMDSLRYVYSKIWIELQKAENSLLVEFHESNELIELNDKFNQKIISEEEAKEQYDNLYVHLITTSNDNIKAKIIASNPTQINLIPEHIIPYANATVDKWIDNAIYAKYSCHENQQYIIKKVGDEKVIVLVDYANTGITLKDTVWSYGLHQFLQLKHELCLTAESLTSSCISNYGYIHKYGNNIFGLTGTLGSKSEQELLSSIYNVVFSKVPTYKPKLFKELDGIVVNDDHWGIEVAVESVEHVENGRAVLVICKTISDLKQIEENLIFLQKFQDDISADFVIKKYENEDDAVVTRDIVKPGDIILATNIAGRGADFKTTSDLECNAGLHVCISYCPDNERVKAQAMFRTARQGNRGTAQLILKESEIRNLGIVNKDPKDINFADIQKAIDKLEAERIKTIKDIKVAEINLQDNLFEHFSKLYKGLKMNNINSYVLKDLKEFWAVWLEQQQFDGKHFTEELARKDYENFEYDRKTQRIINGKIKHNPYYAIQQAEFYLRNNEFTKAKESLNNAITLSSNPDILYSAYVKLFEVSVGEAKVLQRRVIHALSKVAFVGYVMVNIGPSNKAAIEYLLKAKISLKQEIDYIKNYFIENPDIGIILTNTQPEENIFLKHIKSRLICLNIYFSNVEALENQMRENPNEGFTISSRISDYLKNLDPNTDERKLKEAITNTELSELGLIGLETLYALKEIYDVPTEIIISAQAQILVGLAYLATGIAFPPALPALGQLAGLLISEGICDIVFELIKTGDTKFNKEMYIKSKVISYGISLVTMGVSAILQCTQVLDKAIEACKTLSDLLRKSPVFKTICGILATQIDNLAIILKHMNMIVQANNLSKMTALSSYSICTSFFGNIVKNTLKSVAGTVVMEKIITGVLETMLDSLKPEIKILVKDKLFQFTELYNKIKQMKTETVYDVSKELLEGPIKDQMLEVAEQIALGVVRHSRYWTMKALSLVLDSVFTGCKIYDLLNCFSHELNRKLGEDFPIIEGNQIGTEVIEELSNLISNQIYNLITQLTGKYAHTIAVGPLINKICNFVENLNSPGDKIVLYSQINKNGEDPYEILGLTPGASDEDIKKAYRALVLTYHPNLPKNKGDEMAFNMMVKINSAHQSVIEMRNKMSQVSTRPEGSSQQVNAHQQSSDQSSIQKYDNIINNENLQTEHESIPKLNNTLPQVQTTENLHSDLRFTAPMVFFDPFEIHKKNSCVLLNLAERYIGVSYGELCVATGKLNIGKGANIADCKDVLCKLQLAVVEKQFSSRLRESDVIQFLEENNCDRVMMFLSFENSSMGHAVVVRKEGNMLNVLDSQENSPGTSLSTYIEGSQSIRNITIISAHNFSIMHNKILDDVVEKAGYLCLPNYPVEYIGLDENSTCYGATQREQNYTRRIKPEGSLYPSGKIKIKPAHELKSVLAELRNHLSALEKNADDFDLGSADALKFWKFRKYIPIFGYDYDAKKNQMMMGALEVNFKSGESLKILALSGHGTLCVKQICAPDERNGLELKTERYEPTDFKYKDFVLINMGNPTGKPIFDVHAREEINEKYTKCCAAQKCLYTLGKHMKNNPHLEIKGDVQMTESRYKQTNTKVKGTQIGIEDSCPYCEVTLPFVMGKDS